MRVRAFRLGAVLVGSFAAAIPVAGQSVVLRMDPEPGLQSRYVLRLQMDMESALLPSDQPFMVGTVHSTQSVLGREGDVVEYSIATDSMRISTPAMPMAQQQIPDQTGQVVTMKIDTRGRVVEMGEGLDGEARQFAGQLGGMQLQLPEDAMSPGDSWESQVESSLPGIPGASGAMQIHLLYTLVEVADAGGSRLATISFQGPVTMSGQGAAGGMQASGRMSGTMVFDVTLGRLASSDVVMDLGLNAGGLEMKMHQTMTMTLVN
jgi:hypothetical protein